MMVDYDLRGHINYRSVPVFFLGWNEYLNMLLTFLSVLEILCKIKKNRGYLSPMAKPMKNAMPLTY